MESEYLIQSINEIKSILSEMKKEIREDILCHKKENETDILRLYDMASNQKDISGDLKNKLNILDTEYNSFRKLSNILLLGVAGAVVMAIMTLILK